MQKERTEFFRTTREKEPREIEELKETMVFENKKYFGGYADFFAFIFISVVDTK